MGKELLTKEDLAKVSEHRFYFRMSLEERMRIRDNMNNLKSKHELSMSEVLRKVMLEYMNDDEFLRFIGLLEQPTG
ncbi:MAG: hypothetical protein A2513_04345 [Sulfurimonas sp. RIFOXYD12_FULL_33_39]|uniref:hypothetical protein n=1 Tax=unclassified Sulfurimonas TaxID=2623549 RepID=UPI0008B1DB6F|nr:MULTISPECIES: hypothetical protein [unclassified Sulfurimonas]OHE09364.1 MAG: hypothetical protein A2513_04345 [Sulfurimonas sp. RIFOXYD12_FULL_33_39]OHE12853.1 MAG: hypothetical protein A2530_04460 [Sulfurimonas sp. RIFOXYD2_FULL_34_21]